MIRVASSWNHGNILKTACLLPQPLRLLTTQPGLLVESSKDDQSEARRWLATFNQSTIPRSLCQITFSRSSGPGGQNVNKYILDLEKLISQSPTNMLQSELQGHSPSGNEGPVTFDSWYPTPGTNSIAILRRERPCLGNSSRWQQEARRQCAGMFQKATRSSN